MKEECLRTHEHCLDIRLRLLGEKHIDTAQSLNNIAIVLLALQRAEDALATHNRCLAIRMDILGMVT